MKQIHTKKIQQNMTGFSFEWVIGIYFLQKYTAFCLLMDEDIKIH